MNIERNNLLIGGVAIIVGVIFLLSNFNVMPDVFQIGKLWPVFVILGGLFIMFLRSNNEK